MAVYKSPEAGDEAQLDLLIYFVTLRPCAVDFSEFMGVICFCSVLRGSSLPPIQSIFFSSSIFVPSLHLFSSLLFSFSLLFFHFFSPPPYVWESVMSLDSRVSSRIYFLFAHCPSLYFLFLFFSLSTYLFGLLVCFSLLYLEYAYTLLLHLFLLQNNSRYFIHSTFDYRIHKYHMTHNIQACNPVISSIPF